jgi:hypothetical protein
LQQAESTFGIVQQRLWCVYLNFISCNNLDVCRVFAPHITTSTPKCRWVMCGTHPAYI